MGRFRYRYKLTVLTLLLLLGCAGNEISINEGVAGDGTPLTESDKLSAGLEEEKHTDIAIMTGDGLEAPNTLDKIGESKEALGQDEKMKVTAQYLNVRQGPGKDFRVVKVLKEGDMVEVLEKQGKWAKINENEFVSLSFLRQP